MKSKLKAIKDLTQGKIVDIGQYRSLYQGQEGQRVAVVTQDATLFEALQNQLPKKLQVMQFDGRFSFEQTLKGTEEWDAVILDERELADEVLQLCEKLKRQGKMEDSVLIVLSASNDKERVRAGLEKGCDEWLSRPDDVNGLVRLLDHYLHLNL